ncbi:hydroxyacid dehydrogenase [Candidatus Bathyarchaeota archaeon]|nr:hydroxyacid dehydrogenase [Candidatus Bathyarchaeota archaeon]
MSASRIDLGAPTWIYLSGPDIKMGCWVLARFSIFVTEPVPGIEAELTVLKDVDVRIKDRFLDRVDSEDLRNVDAVIAGDSKITRESLKAADRLKVIGRLGAGVDSVDVKACTEMGILVFNAPGLNAQSVAEHIMGLMVAVAKKFRTVDILVRSGRWAEKAHHIGYELFGKTLGIVGLGNIGSRLAKMAQAFGMAAIAYDPYIPVEKALSLNVKLVDLEVLLRDSDFISINAPLTEETKGLIGERQLRMMKRNAILINTARGGLVDEKALYEALKNNWIAGAGIDVLENEPVTDHPLFKLENVILTPHTASWTVEAFRRVVSTVCENILKTLNGGIPENLVNPEVLERTRL